MSLNESIVEDAALEWFGELGYLRVREILALAADYEATDAETQVFFQTIQNKLHFAATGKTAAELIATRADCRPPPRRIGGARGSGLARTARRRSEEVAKAQETQTAHATNCNLTYDLTYG